MGKSIDIKISKLRNHKTLKFCSAGGDGVDIIQLHDDGRERISAIGQASMSFTKYILDSKFGFSDKELSQITKWLADKNYSDVVKLFESKGWVNNSEPILRFELPDVDSWDELIAEER